MNAALPMKLPAMRRRKGVHLMCAGVDFGSIFSGQNMLFASSALKGVAQITEGNQGAKYLEYQSAQAHADADAERQIAALRAGKVRKAGAIVSAEAMAAQGASGSSVNSGSAYAVREYIDKGAESDALVELYGGDRRARSLEATAQGYRAQAGLTRAGGYGAAGGTLLKGAGSLLELAAAEARLKRRNDGWLRNDRNQYSLDNLQYG